MAKAVKVKPVMAWAVVVDGELLPAWICQNLRLLRRDMASDDVRGRVIRVIIRPAPRRKK